MRFMYSISLGVIDNEKAFDFIDNHGIFDALHK